MLANVAAWIVGIFLSYVAHDEDPEYVDATRQWNTAHRAWTASRSKYEKDIRHTQAKFDKIIGERRIAAKTRADSVENELTMLKQITAHEDALRKEVEQVTLSNIETYREALSRSVLAAAVPVQITNRTTNAIVSPFELNVMPLPSGQAIQTLLAA